MVRGSRGVARDFGRRIASNADLRFLVRRILVIVGFVGLLAGVTPLVVQRSLLPASSSLESDAALAGFLYLSVALSVLLLCLAIPRSQGPTLAAARAIFFILTLALIV